MSGSANGCFNKISKCLGQQMSKQNQQMSGWLKSANVWVSKCPRPVSKYPGSKCPSAKVRSANVKSAFLPTPSTNMELLNQDSMINI